MTQPLRLVVAALFAAMFSVPQIASAGENEYQVSLHPPLAACGRHCECLCELQSCRQPHKQDRYYFGNLYGADPKVSYAYYGDCYEYDCGVCCAPKARDLIAYVKISDACGCKACVRQIPLSVPADCCEEPAMSHRCVVAGHHVVKLTWASGFRVTIRLHKNGDARVVYRG